MSKRSPVAIFLAASTLMAASSLQEVSHSAEGRRCNREELIEFKKSGEKGKCISKGMGGLKEWNTDQGVNDKSTLDKDAKKAAAKAKKNNVCIPIGEGENCW